jgi:ankyrin repeat protein
MGTTALGFASTYGHVEVVRALLDGGADADKNPTGMSAIFRAVVKGHSNTVKVLVEHGAHVDTQTPQGWSPLSIACELGKIEIIEILVDHGARVDLKDNIGASPLHLASATGNIEAVVYLLAHGAHVDIQTNTGQTPLIVASGAGKTEVVRVLLDHGAQVNLEMEGGTAPLDVASVGGHTETVRLLLERGARKHLSPTKEKPFLSVVCGRGHAETVRVLVKHGAPVNFKGQDDRTPLYVSCLLKQPKVVKVLLELGADPNMQDTSGNSALFVSCIYGLVDAVIMLLDNGAIPDLPALGMAIHGGYTAIVGLLLDRLNGKHPGSSALLAASTSKNEEIKALFNQHGYDVGPGPVVLQILQPRFQSALRTNPTAGQGDTGQGTTGQGATGQGATGQGATGQGATGQGATGQGAAGQGATAAERRDLITGLAGSVLSAMLSQTGTSPRPTPESNDQLLQHMQAIILDKLKDLKPAPKENTSEKVPPPQLPPSSVHQPKFATPAQTHAKKLSLSNVIRELMKLDSEWQNIGVLLNIPSARLKKIANDYTITRDCLREMVTEWLKMVDPPPTWELLVEAVELIDPQTAENIHTKYCTT